MRSCIQRVTGWFRASLFPRLFAPILLMAGVVLISAAISDRLFFQDTMIRSFEAAEQNYLAMQAENVEKLLSGYVKQLYSAAVDTALLELAKDLDATPRSQRSKLERAAREYLDDTIFNSDVYAATLALEDGGFIVYTRLQDTQNWSSWFSTISREGYNAALAELCRRAHEAGRAVVGVMPATYEPSGIRLIHLACPVYDLLTRVSYGTIVFSVNTAPLCQAVNPAGAIDSYAHGILTDPAGVVIAHADPSFAYQPLSAWAGDPAGDIARGALPEKPLLLRRDVDRLGYALFRVVDQNLLRQSVRRYTRRILLFVVPVLCVTLAVVALLLRRWTRSIRALREGINAVSSGNLQVRAPVSDGTEIGQIAEAFNHMAEQLDQSGRREAEHARRALEALNRQRIAEIRMLENQINSHFLYNTLNTINYTAMQSGSINTSRQIKHLANMLRYTFQDSDAVVTAAQEAEWLEEYLSLQRLRFGESFDCAVRVDPGVADWPMRKLLAQPFVENSVIHGFAGRDGGGWLSVDFLPYRDGRMRIVVRDNGRGMTPERLAEIRARFAGTGRAGDGGIGLANARQRLLSYYGGRAGVSIRSWPGQGTVAVLLLPRVEAKN
ncbi:MAG: sensor histidine kinase [Clostridia bacterium]|nr:sensor histidine kinase [Clostridia bacterium]